MATHFINYVLLAAGILTVLAAVIMIILDKLKGDDMCFDLDVKEQELKKVIEDAEEILSELNFTSDVIVKDIQEKINGFNQLYQNASSSLEQISARHAQAEIQPVIQSPPKPALHTERTIVPVKFKPITAAGTSKTVKNEEPPKSKQQMVLELAGQGMGILDIAKRLNMGQGEVTLILSLKNEESEND